MSDMTMSKILTLTISAPIYCDACNRIHMISFRNVTEFTERLDNCVDNVTARHIYREIMNDVKNSFPQAA